MHVANMLDCSNKAKQALLLTQNEGLHEVRCFLQVAHIRRVLRGLDFDLYAVSLKYSEDFLGNG